MANNGIRNKIFFQVPKDCQKHWKSSSLSLSHTHTHSHAHAHTLSLSSIISPSHTHALSLSYAKLPKVEKSGKRFAENKSHYPIFGPKETQVGLLSSLVLVQYATSVSIIFLPILLLLDLLCSKLNSIGKCAFFM